MGARGRLDGLIVSCGIVLVLALAGAWEAQGDTPPADAYDGGDGSAGDPYQIATLAQLRRLSEMSTDWGGHFVLTADIDAWDTATWNVGDHDGDAGTPDEAMGFSPIGEDGGTRFSGGFDGNGHTIAGLYINRPDQGGVGLFGRSDSGASVSNVGVVEVDITGRILVGGLVGCNEGNITSCYATGPVSGAGTVGGLVGQNWGDIDSCYATGTVTGNGFIGGLVGESIGTGTITSCHATGAVSGAVAIGGLVGHNWRGLIGHKGSCVSSVASSRSCCATGAVRGTEGGGGVIGTSSGPAVRSCYTTGAVSGMEDVGGLIGSSFEGEIATCYAAGAVSGTEDVGGLVGENQTPIEDSCWDTETSGTATGIGRDHTGVATATGLTSAAMQQQAGFPDWDFASTWAVVEGETRPYLQWQAVALFEGEWSAVTHDGFTVEEGYVYNTPGSGIVVTEYGFVVREAGSVLETFGPVASGQSLGEGAGVALDGLGPGGLTRGTTYLYRVYATDDQGVTHFGTERSVTPDNPCDVDCNGVVDAVDVQLVINAALGLSVAYDCDANKDGSVDAVDVQLVINAALGL